MTTAPDQSALWTTGSVAAAVAGRATADLAVTGVAIDSREVVPGDLFVALAGRTSDGHAHAARALQAGAAAALVHRPCPGLAVDDHRLVHCADTQAALVALGAAARDRSSARRVGITGSAGKTGTVRALAQALAPMARAHASVRSFNNHVGVPLSLARMGQRADVGVFEIGMNAAGEIAALADQVRPHVGIVTSVGAAHLGAFPNEAAIAEEKGALFRHLAPGGTAIVNLDAGHADRLIAIAREAGVGRVVTVSLDDPAADVHGLRADLRADGTRLAVAMGGRHLALKVATPGRALAGNALAVLAAVDALGLDPAMAGLALARLTAGPGRGRVLTIPVAGGTATLIDESYNANPLSMEAALATLGRRQPAAGGRRVAVLGDMAELGGEATARHRALSGALKGARVAEVIAFGPLSALMGRAAGLPVLDLAEPPAAAEAVRARLAPGDVVMVKGSNTGGLGALVEALTRPGRVQSLAGFWAVDERAA
ncbi:hypothetical protein CCR85_09415 [Rhodothalassium salexigens]|uniref:UDP-N-acetylmuramoyl-tripeptide--D-alanyl-D- alanine ligase n=1 Tax=Rhodothalassium salexigens TaxID=1086 RepID=UPI0019125417|nr:UDP-N-acetylmuramoyl-tripeptide--D-alanyl-D-alanine ligase [Rhodothalassium salexigens]MBK5911703.1 hypothetical protein [Rhodothalassium salexigens]MBK5919708.1 hypothetical protein [Rhodothalassium salexigens]